MSGCHFVCFTHVLLCLDFRSNLRVVEGAVVDSLGGYSVKHPYCR